ncbi:AUGMIN subunit 6 [Camellia lanceoleosa]|uniref:AUGMIN subunit 6 n=1 Tax=Camellia lanceoleosa TaxID=1840588 RepID=A0ACC0G8A6_9ERIC|nr:AUGMIN subunit 6 [Camellia lanceoleosa]
MLRRFALHKSHGKEKRDYQLSVHLYDLSQASEVLINQMKDVAPAIQNSITEVTEEVNSISSNLPPVTQHHGRSTSSIQAQSSGTTMESSNDEVADVTSRLSTVQLAKVSASPSALKLPSLFSATPNSLGKHGNMQKRQTLAQTSQMEKYVRKEKSYCDGEEALDHVFSPPLLMDSSFLGDPYEDLLAPLSETETALMER